MENMEGVENFPTRMNADIKAIKTDAEQSALFTGELFDRMATDVDVRFRRLEAKQCRAG